MRLLAIFSIVSFLLIGLVPVSAQTVFPQGIWQFESYIPDMVYVGTWNTITSANVTMRSATTSVATVKFFVTGKVLLIHHFMYPASTGSQFQVCIGTPVPTCTMVTATTGATIGLWYGSSFPLAAGTNQVIITYAAGTVSLDYIMILADPSGSFPTPVPTATILPSSTPATTTTPQPTPTPQPTATPYTLPGAIWAIDPARQYGSINGQITSMEYSATAADIQVANLLTFLVFSVWGFFFFSIFVLVRYKQK